MSLSVSARHPVSFSLLYLIFLFVSSYGFCQTGFIEPGKNLIIENIPPVPASLKAELGKYTESKSAGFAAWHPVRKEMLVSTRSGNTAQLHLVKEPLGEKMQITFENEPVRSASYEPLNGEYFIFMKDTGGDEFTQMYRHDPAAGETVMLTKGGRIQYGFPVWSNSGKLIAYTSTERNGEDRDLYVMDPLVPGSEKLAAQLNGGGWGVRDWSPDDRFLLISNFISRTESHYFLLDLSTGVKRAITSKESQKAFYTQGEFSPDGKFVYCITDLGGNFRRAAIMNTESGSIEFLTPETGYEVEEIELSPDGRILAYRINKYGESEIRLLDITDMSETAPEDLPKGVASNLEFHNDNTGLCFSLNHAKSSNDVFVYDVKTGVITAWTESEMGGLNPQELSIPNLIKWNSFDGLGISGFYYKPPEKFKGRRPVIINIHGGPEGQSRPDYIGFSNYYLNELGIAMIYPNVRGSTGFGREFMELDNGYNRENSVKDIGALLDHIAAHPELDPERVMVTGGSYGGYMALAVSVHYPDRIRCAVDVVGISNFNTFLRNTESYRRDARRAEYGDERDSAMSAFLERISPLGNAGMIRNPILIVQGGNDPRVPRTEAEQMKNVIESNGGTVWYLEASDEGHGFSKKSNADFQRFVTVMFVKEFLLND